MVIQRSIRKFGTHLQACKYPLKGCNTVLHKKLQAMKESSGMTVQQIADKSGIPASTISRILSGDTANPLFQNVVDIIKAMNGSLDLIAGIVPQQTNSDSYAELYREIINRTCDHYESELKHARALGKILMHLFISVILITVIVVVILFIYDFTHIGTGYFK